MGYRLEQEVVLLDGTSLVGRIVDGMLSDVRGDLKPHYKVSVKGSPGRWFSEDEITPYEATEPPAAVQAVGAEPGAGDVSDYSRGYRAGIVDGYTGELSAFAQAALGDDTLAVALYSEAALEARIKELEAENQRLRDALELANDLLDNIERNLPQSPEVAENRLVWSGIAWSALLSADLIRAYQKATKQDAATGGGE